MLTKHIFWEKYSKSTTNLPQSVVGVVDYISVVEKCGRFVVDSCLSNNQIAALRHCQENRQGRLESDSRLSTNQIAAFSHEAL